LSFFSSKFLFKMARVRHDKHQGLKGNLRNTSGWDPLLGPASFRDTQSRSHLSRQMRNDSRDNEDEESGHDEVRLVSLSSKREPWVPPGTAGSGAVSQIQNQNFVSRKALNAKIRDLEEKNKMLISQVDWLERKNVDLMSEVRSLKLDKEDFERELETCRRSNFDSHSNPKSGGVSASVDTGGDRFLPGQRLEPSFISHRPPVPEYEYSPNSWSPPPAEKFRRNHDQQLPYPKRTEYLDQERPTERASWREPARDLGDYQQEQRGPARDQFRPAQDTGNHVNPNSRFDSREDIADGQRSLQQSQRVGFEHRNEKLESDRSRFELSTRSGVQRSGGQGWDPIRHDSEILKKPAVDAWGRKDVAPRMGGGLTDKEDTWGTYQQSCKSITKEPNTEWMQKPSATPHEPAHWSPPSNQRMSMGTPARKTPMNRSSFPEGEEALFKRNDRPGPKASRPPVKKTEPDPVTPSSIDNRKTGFCDPVTPSSSDVESDTNEPVQRGWRNPGSV